MKNTNQQYTAIILAAGIGKRMNSQKPKVMHKIAGKPMIQHTVDTMMTLKPAELIIVANPHNLGEIRSVVPPYVKFAVQEEQLGTANAALIGLNESTGNMRDVAVLYGDDTAFYTAQTISKVYKLHSHSRAKITFVTLFKDNPQGLGRIVRKNNKLVGIVEEKDASRQQKTIKEVNDGLYFFDREYLQKNIKRLKPSIATGELYLTDLIEIALKNHEKVETYILSGHGEWHGINNQLELAKANFKLNKNIHIMGISGAGASAVANIAAYAGYKVSGCDINISNQYYGKLKLETAMGHSENHINDIACLIISPAIQKLNFNNAELMKAQKEGIPVITWEEFQGGILQENKFVIAVAGAYGKSTTTAMVGKILEDQNWDPTVEVGAKVMDWDKNFRNGKSKYYVCEADEYNNNFLNYYPDIAILLNIEWDHPDFFKTKAEIEESYCLFINNLKTNGTLITTPDVIKKLAREIRKDIKVITIKQADGLNLKMIGDFRKENASAAIELAGVLKLNIKQAIGTINNFAGLGRRLEYKGKINGVDFYDDYAVQPYTIEKTANALKNKYKSARLLLIIEPHTLSRVQMYYKKFIESIKNTKCDQIYIKDVFAARENGNVSLPSKSLAAQIGGHTQYSGTLIQTVDLIRKRLKYYDVICTMGAGEVYKIYDMLKNG